ncbi:MAG: type I glyceraldehyde-3-phosphate dehydrogenase [Thermodesulfobacteriota bacterium]
MGFRIAINGYGRIGRCVLRALYESGRREGLVVVGINDLSGIDSMAHLTCFDSTHGRFAGRVSHEGTTLYVNDDPIAVSFERNPAALPWGRLGVDAVMECTGSFTDRAMAEGHLKSGAKKVVFSCPAENVDATIVYGINHTLLQKSHTVISNASCTSNCIVPVIDVLDRALGIDHGMVTTIHCLMNDQPVIDAYHNRDLRKSRSSSQSVIPVNTGLPSGIDRLLPRLAGRFQAIALRVPTTNVSAMQLTAQVNTKTDARAVNEIFTAAAGGPLSGILGYTELPLVSCDFNHDPHSAVIDGSQTRVSGDTGVSVLAWFDNEWGYANRMLDTTLALLSA